MILVSCIQIVFINLTQLPINANDINVFNRAQHVCMQKPYGGCVTSLIKKGKTDYEIKCGNRTSQDLGILEQQRVRAILQELRHLSPEETVKAMKRIGITEW